MNKVQNKLGENICDTHYRQKTNIINIQRTIENKGKN